jgi:hypothetical protein
MIGHQQAPHGSGVRLGPRENALAISFARRACSRNLANPGQHYRRGIGRDLAADAYPAAETPATVAIARAEASGRRSAREKTAGRANAEPLVWSRTGVLLLCRPGLRCLPG